MEKFNSMVEAIKNIAILIASGLAIAYWYSYDFEVLFKEKVLNQSHWFYVAIWTNENKYIDQLYQIHKSDHDAANGKITSGNIIRSTAETIVGRTNAGLSDGKARYIGNNDDCLHVLDSKVITFLANEGSSKQTKRLCSKNRCNAIWVRAIPNMCG